MFLKLRLKWNVVIPAEDLDIQGSMLPNVILVRLLHDFAARKATKDLGYFMGVTSLDRIGEGKVREQAEAEAGDVIFRVTFTCLTFKIVQGEVIEGVVHRILRRGVFLRCGPIQNLYLSDQMMSDYQYLVAENPCFVNLETGSMIEKDSSLRCIVIGVRFMEAQKEFEALVSLEGDDLGPV